MFSKVAFIALVAYVRAAAETVSEGGNEVANEVGQWSAETYEIKSVQTIRKSNTSMAIAPAQCSDGCPCCTPKIDVKASVIGPVPGKRAHAAMIFDYGSCKVGYEGYTMSIDWGDDEGAYATRDELGPWHPIHTYAKKGKYAVEVTLCAAKDGCDEGCTTVSKKVKVKK